MFFFPPLPFIVEDFNTFLIFDLEDADNSFEGLFLVVVLGVFFSVTGFADEVCFGGTDFAFLEGLGLDGGVFSVIFGSSEISSLSSKKEKQSFMDI